MEVLKIELDGITTSFRMPHFLVGRQMSYPMPPPATIYGHVCSAVGDFLPPESFKFAYYFTYQGKGDDMEAIYQTVAGSGKVDKKWGEVKNVELTMNPVLRQLFLFPKLELYIDAPGRLEEFYNAFICPRYPVILGRSQDIAGYRSVKSITLEKNPFTYFEGTRLPNTYSRRTGTGISVIVPKFIDPNDRRNVSLCIYIAIDRRIFLTDKQEEGVNLIKPEQDESFWIDPETPEIRGLHRSVIWHSFVEEESVVGI